MTELPLQVRPAADRTRVLVIGALVHRTARQLREHLSSLLNTDDCSGEIILDLRCCTGAWRSRMSKPSGSVTGK